jgi:hypothetical protein
MLERCARIGASLTRLVLARVAAESHGDARKREQSASTAARSSSAGHRWWGVGKQFARPVRTKTRYSSFKTLRHIAHLHTLVMPRHRAQAEVSDGRWSRVPRVERPVLLD